MYPKEMKTGYQRVICTPMFIAALFTIAKIWQQAKCPSTVERIKMFYIHAYIHMNTHIYISYIHTHSGIFSHKKEGNPTVHNNMDGYAK